MTLREDKKTSVQASYTYHVHLLTPNTCCGCEYTIEPPLSLSFWPGTVLYASLVALSMLITLVFAASFRKCRQVSKPQQQRCSNSRDVSADEKEV